MGLGFFCEPFNFIRNSFNCNELHQPPLTHASHIMTALTIPQKFSYFWFRKGRPEKRKMFLVILSLADPGALSFFCTAKVRFHLLSLKGVGLGVLVCPTFILKYIKNRMYEFWLSQTKRVPSLAESLVVPQKLRPCVARCGRYKDAFHRTVLWPEAANNKILTASEILRCDGLRASDCKPTNRMAAGNDTMTATTDTADKIARR